MTRQQLPPQIKKITVGDRKTGKPVVRYQLTVDTGINPETGRRQQARRRYATEKQARQALAEIAQQVKTYTFVPRKAVTVGELCDEWLASLHNARPTTINGYAYCLAPLREHYAHLVAQKLTRQDLDKLLIALRDGGTKTVRGHTRRAWSPRSLNAAIDAWRLMLAYGNDRKDLANNVAAAMKKVSRPRREMQTYTPDEIHRVLRTADKDRNGHRWYLALSGLRRGEIAGAKWSDIDFDAGTITIARNRVQVGAATVVENEPKTQSSRRTLPLDDGLVSVLKRASARYAQEKLALGAAALRQRLRRGERGRGTVQTGGADEHVASADGSCGRAPDPVARCSPLLRHGFAPAGCADGRDRQMARTFGRLDHSPYLRPLPGRRIACRQRNARTSRYFRRIAQPHTSSTGLVTSP